MSELSPVAFADFRFFGTGGGSFVCVVLLRLGTTVALLFSDGIPSVLSDSTVGGAGSLSVALAVPLPIGRGLGRGPGAVAGWISPHGAGVLAAVATRPFFLAGRVSANSAGVKVSVTSPAIEELVAERCLRFLSLS